MFTDDTSALYDNAFTVFEVDPAQAGRYVVTYKGEGSVEYSGDAKLISSSGNKFARTDIIELAGEKGARLAIESTDPNNTGDYIRNISIVAEEYHNSNNVPTFNPDFIDYIDDFTTLRFMNWMRTNGSIGQDWSQRAHTKDYTYASAEGVPLEVMIELGNQTGQDVWFNIPHKADDGYVRRFAQKVKANLNPEIDIYVEYSNEVWNFNFGQAKWAKGQADAEGLSQVDWFSKRTTEINSIWKDVFGEQKDRVKGVVASQASNIGRTENTLDYDWTDTPKSHEEYGNDVIAIAPYFGRYIGERENEDTLLAWAADPEKGLDNLFTEIREGGLVDNSPKGGALQLAYNNIQKHIDLAKREGLELVAYEGGQHLVAESGNKTLVDFFAQANRDPRMGEIYEDYLETWFNLGGGEFVNFNDVKNYGTSGYWGLSESIYEPGAKYDSVVGLIGQPVNTPA